MRRLELLSPARDEAAARAALANGADAVYIGAPAFGARRAAANDLATVERVAREARRHGARLFVTLNTLLRDDELPAAARLARDLHDAGVDALIVQDMAMLQLDLPPIALHASTQAHNYDLDRLKFLDRVGFRRVVLARELSLGQIRAARRETSLELECFVHGALCVGLSGQCYLSACLSGRSANRGECAQLCRARWDLDDADGRPLARGKHLLSLKDLNLSARLGDLIDAGVTSFKIEGRLKDPAYVANVTRHYSMLLDREVARRGDLSRASPGEVTACFDPDPGRGFNRGFTTYFLDGRRRGMVNEETPKSTGKRVARVVAADGRRLTVEALEPLHNADGLCYLHDGELKGFLVNGVEGDRLSCSAPVTAPPGAWLYRNHDHEFETLLARHPSSRVIRLEIEARAVDRRLQLDALDEEGTRASLRPAERLEPAARPGQEEAICRQLSRCGGSGFRCTRVSYDGEPLFAPASLVNGYRRLLLETLAANRERSRDRWVQAPFRVGVPFPGAPDWRLNVANALAERFYRACGVALPATPVSPSASSLASSSSLLAPSSLPISPSASSLSPAASSFSPASSPLPLVSSPLSPPVASLSPFPFESPAFLRGKVVLRSRYCLLFERGACLKRGGAALVTPPLFLSNNLGRLRVEFDCDACFMQLVAL
ncbi:MAG: U32 family peptidase [Odoribacteraceae bacterium]|nr:U32 family peptidase [Odoribacteraceae bacterium]